MTDAIVLRKRISHDLLKNGLLPAIGCAIHIVEGKVAGGGMQHVVSELALNWSMVKAETLILLEHIEPDLSPQALISMPPLDQLPSDIRDDLAKLVHENWLLSFNIPEVKKRIQNTLETADKEAAMLPDLARSDVFSSDALRQLRGFHGLCGELGVAVSSLPRTIMV